MHDDDYISKLHQRIERGSKRGQLTSTLCRNLAGFVNDPLSHLFGNNLLADVYREMVSKSETKWMWSGIINTLTYIALRRLNKITAG